MIHPFKQRSPLTDRGFAAGSAVLSGNLQETVSIDFKSGHKLSLATGHGRYASELKLAEKAIVTALRTLTLVHREGNGCLIILDSGEDTRLVGGNRGIAGNDNTEDIPMHGNTKG